jgi:hypothetical protein
LALRLWGIRHGMPYAYNVDENAHFVPRAIGIFGHGLNPHYFVNPPAFTYLLHAVFALWFGGRDAVGHAYATDPAEVFVLARVVSALLGTLAVWLLYVAGARLLGRRAGLLAAALLAVAFLPVFYSHLALNDAPALAPVALALAGSAGVLRHGRRRDYLLAGAGVGLAWATKYTAAIVLLPFLAAALCTPRRRPARLGMGLGAALLCAVAAHPYALLDWHSFSAGLAHQNAASGVTKLGLTEPSGYRYYLWSLTWGIGWLPALASAAGAVWLVRAHRRVAAVLVPAPLVFIAYMGSQERYFGRWLMPVLPIVCLFAAAAAVALVDMLGRRWPRLARPALALAGLALCAQGLVFSLHSDALLARADTRALTRAWLVGHVPAGARIVVEPVVSDTWLGGGRWTPVGQPGVAPSAGASKRLPDGQPLVRIPRSPGVVGSEGYVRTLSPARLDAYERAGACWVVSGSIQSGRAFADPAKVPRAIAYYRELARRADVVYRASPVGRGDSLGAFNFDWSFDGYPLRYGRFGPAMTVYRLRGTGCGWQSGLRAGARNARRRILNGPR